VTLPTGTIEVMNATKTYRLYHEQYRTLKERLLHLGRIPFHEFHAIHDIDFTASQGTMLGILGHNGSGKSTLLKCIAGTVEPTTGSIQTRGRLAALLELGAGFHPELSGRENLYLAGSIMGYTKRDIGAVFDEIVAFAELEQFIDNQVKHYSSGMFARLGFALAVNVEPDILLIDEVLAVGDEAFQQKCLDRIRDFRDQGVTILLVTHDADLAAAICDELVVLDRGQVIAHGTPADAAVTYRRHLYGESELPAEGSIDPVGGVRFDGLRFEADGRATTTVRQGDRVAIAFELITDVPIPDLVVAYAIRETGRNLVHSTNSSILGLDLGNAIGSTTIRFVIDEIPLLNGLYDLDLGAHSLDGSEHYAQIDTAGRFAVVGSSPDAGVVRMSVRCERAG